MIKVFFINNWGEPDTTLKRYSKQTPNNLGIWDNLVGVSDINEADYFIALETVNTNTPIDKTIFIKREPDYIRRLGQLNFKHVIDFNKTNGGVTYWLDKTYDELSNLEYPDKQNLISCVASSKHSHRNNYIKSLFKDDSSIHLYGRGHDVNYYGDNYKGELNYAGNCKFKGLIDYKFTIVMENSQQKNYWTEKLADAYLSWCMPIYWGCPNISDYFPENSYKLIDINSTDPIRDINEIISKPLTDEEIKAIGEARNLILNKYNIWEVVNAKIKEIENGN